MPRAREFRCAGIDGSVSLREDEMTITTRVFARKKVHNLAVARVESVLVQRKSVVPFLSLTLIAVIAAVVAQFNALWFLIALDPPRNTQVATVAILFGVVFAIPTLARALFVNVLVIWVGRPKSFLVHLVLVGSGRRLARRFHRISGGA